LLCRDLRLSRYVSIYKFFAAGSDQPPNEFVEGAIVSDIEFMPSIALFGPVPLPKTVKDTVAVRSISGRGFRILSVRDLPADDSLNVTSTDDSKILAIRQRAVALGDQERVIRVAVRWDDGREKEVPLQVCYQGVAPDQ
jgi:hypothetical protein